MTTTVRGKKYGFIVLMPQMSKDYFQWQNFYVEDMIRYAKQNLPIDSNKIFLTGWSLGGGGAWKFPTASIDSANLIAGIIISAGAPNYSNLCNIAKGRVAVWAHHAVNDASIPPGYTRDAVRGINECSPEIPARLTYYRKGKHTLIATIVYDSLNTYQYPNMLQWMVGISRANHKATNVFPVPDAGKDTSVVLPSLTATLDGSNSYDPDDVIVTYYWKMLSGPASPELRFYSRNYPQTKVTGLKPGKYVFRLTVTDAFNHQKSDDVNVDVSLPRNGANAVPFVYIGKDQAVSCSYVALKADMQDFDGKLAGSSWKQLSGPTTANIFARGDTADVFGMNKKGSYQFELSAWDDATPTGVTRDTVVILRNLPLRAGIIYWLTQNIEDKTNWKTGLWWIAAGFATLGLMFLMKYVKI